MILQLHLFGDKMMRTMMKEGNFGTVAVSEGYLEISYNKKVIKKVKVPTPNYEAEKNRDSVVENDDGFSDDYGNEYSIYVYSSKYGIDYTIELIHSENELKAKEFCDNLIVEFNSREEHLDNNEFYEEISFVQPSKIFTIKTSKEEWIAKLVNFFDHKNTDDIFYIEGLTQLYNDVEKDNLVFVVAGGDKGKIKLDYIQGLYGVAKVVNAPSYNKDKSYMIGVRFIYFFNKVITRDMFYDYKDLKNIPNIGEMTKGEKNQAISKISIRQAKAIMLASEEITDISNNILFSLFPWVKDEYKSIATENYESLIDTLPPALNVEKIAKVFAKYLINYNSKHTTTLIGIFGMWGRGKTYFFDKVKEYILNTNSEEKKFYFCKFQPWKYQRQEAAWAYLYQKVLESYLEKDIKYLDSSFIKKTLNYQDKLAEKYKNIKWLYKIINSVNLEQKYKIFLLNIKRLGAVKLVSSLIFIFMAGVWIFLIPFEYKLNIFSWLIGSIGIVGMIYMYKSYSFYMISRHTAKNIIDMYGKTNDYSNYLGFKAK